MWLVGAGSLIVTCELVSRRNIQRSRERVSLKGWNGHGKVLRQRQACSRKDKRSRVKVDGGGVRAQGSAVVTAGGRVILESVSCDEDTAHAHLIPIPSLWGTTQKEPHSVVAAQLPSDSQQAPVPDLQAEQYQLPSFPSWYSETFPAAAVC